MWAEETICAGMSVGRGEGVAVCRNLTSFLIAKGAEDKFPLRYMIHTLANFKR